MFIDTMRYKEKENTTYKEKELNTRIHVNSDY